MNLADIYKISTDFKTTPKMPVLFFGHGSPMNAIEDNEFVQQFKKLGEDIPTPQAIICISAHWLTQGTKVTAMPNPRTIHDFGGNISKKEKNANLCEISGFCRCWHHVAEF